MSELGGLGKHQNDPAYIKMSVFKEEEEKLNLKGRATKWSGSCVSQALTNSMKYTFPTTHTHTAKNVNAVHQKAS